MFDEKLKGLIVLAMAVLFFAVGAPFAYSQDNITTKSTGSKVVLSGETLFEIKARIGSFSPEERAQAVSKRLEDFAEDSSISIDSLKIEDEKDQTSVVSGDKIIVSLVDLDAKLANKNRRELTAEHFNKIKASVLEYRRSRSWRNISFSSLYCRFAHF